MEAKERSESRNHSTRHSQIGTPLRLSQNDAMNQAISAKVLGDKLRIAKLRLPEPDPDSMFN